MANKEVDEALLDRDGYKSSKRVWAFRFGNMTLIQVSIFLVYLIMNLAFAHVVPPMIADLTALLADVFKFTISITAGSCLLALGLSIPEWVGGKQSSKVVETLIDKEPEPYSRRRNKDEEDNR